MRAYDHNSGAYLALRAGDLQSLTAGSEPSEVVSPWISVSGYRSGVLSVFASATLTDAATLTLSDLTVETASDDQGTSARALEADASTPFVLTGGTGGSTETGVFRLDVDFEGADTFVRFKYVPAFSRSDTDTANLFSGFVLGGPEVIPTR